MDKSTFKHAKNLSRITNQKLIGHWIKKPSVYTTTATCLLSTNLLKVEINLAKQISSTLIL